MGVNKVILVGRLGKDPELNYTQNQNPVCKFSLATGERRKDASGNWTDHTEWHNIVVWGKTGENCANYLKKGREVYIEGRIQTRKWQDKEGKDRWSTDVIANTVQFLGSKSDSGSATYQSAPMQDASQAPQVEEMAMPAAATTSNDDVAFDDDDIPF